MSYNYLPLDRKWLNFQQVKNLLDYDQQVSITFDAHERILKCSEYVDSLSNKHEAASKTKQSQIDLLKSYAAGIGEEMRADIVKLMLMLKIKSLSYGHSGVQIETVKRLMEMYNNGVLPVVYTQAASSAGGDSIALSHLSLPLAGLGEVYYQGQKRAASSVLLELNWQPLILQGNESLALITGTQFISSYGMYALKKAEHLIKLADAIAALSFSALDCSLESIHPKIHSIHRDNSQAETAATISLYLKGREISVRDRQPAAAPYSFRCTPRVHGAAKDAFEYVLAVFLKEINSVSEDPVIFPDEDLVLSGGNFLGQPLALALDFLSIAISELASISERRTVQLLNEQSDMSLSTKADRRSLPGLKVLQYTAAAIVSENKLLCTPASATGISASRQEDDVIVAGHAATKCIVLINNLEKVLVIELMSAAQLLEKSTETSAFLSNLVQDFRQQVLLNDDSLPKDILLKAIEFIQLYKFKTL